LTLAGKIMDEPTRENSKRYGRWLTAMGLAGGLSGWIVQGMIDEFLLWALPFFCFGAAAFTLNGDNIIESLVMLLMLGGLALVVWNTDAVVSKVGAGTIWGVYVALCISKLGFALGKSGSFGNNQFS
jgi:hypothetical protein